MKKPDAFNGSGFDSPPEAIAKKTIALPIVDLEQQEIVGEGALDVTLYRDTTNDALGGARVGYSKKYAEGFDSIFKKGAPEAN